MMVVMKFGGTSVADADAIRRVTAIVRRQKDADAAPPIVVVSALSKVTDGLLQVGRFVESGERGRALTRLTELADRHVGIAAEVTSGARLAAVTRDLRAEFAATSDMVGALSVLHELSPRLLDTIAATGELASSRLVTAALV